MDRQEYARLSRLAQVSSDEFYRCLSVWIRERADRQRKGCIEKGHEYEKALTDQIVYLQHLELSARRDEALVNCEKLRDALATQMTLLGH
jgi:hypothetical protein